MEYMKLILNSGFLIIVAFTFVYNSLHLIRIKTSNDRIGISAPKIIETLLLLGVFASGAAIIFIGFMIFRSVSSLDSSSLPGIPNLSSLI